MSYDVLMLIGAARIRKLSPVIHACEYCFRAFAESRDQEQDHRMRICRH